VRLLRNLSISLEGIEFRLEQIPQVWK
jgi:hypothetical protein